MKTTKTWTVIRFLDALINLFLSTIVIVLMFGVPFDFMFLLVIFVFFGPFFLLGYLPERFQVTPSYEEQLYYLVTNLVGDIVAVIIIWRHWDIVSQIIDKLWQKFL